MSYARQRPGNNRAQLNLKWYRLRMTDLQKAPDAAFLNDLHAIIDPLGADVLWDPGAETCGGYSVYSIDRATGERLRSIAKRYGMRATYYASSQAMFIARKNATFDQK